MALTRINLYLEIPLQEETVSFETMKKSLF